MLRIIWRLVALIMKFTISCGSAEVFSEFWVKNIFGRLDVVFGILSKMFACFTNIIFSWKVLCVKCQCCAVNFLKFFFWFSMLVTVCDKSWNKKSNLLFFVCNFLLQLFLLQILGNLKEGNLNWRKTVLLGKDSRYGVWRFEMVCIRLAFIVHCVFYRLFSD